MKSRIVSSVILGVVAGVLSITMVANVFAADEPQGDFSLQVSPSTLVTELKPGTDTTLELKIRNTSTSREDLKIETSKFKVDDATGEVRLDNSEPSEIAEWVTFGSPTFSIEPGEWFTQTIRVALPRDTGFSYSLALVISRAQDTATVESGRLLKGSLAVFTLINVDRPGATRELKVEDFSLSSGVYEYLPATMNIVFRNSGNTIVQPYGNVFIQRESDDTVPIATLPVNSTKGYILPGSARTITSEWTEGFPRYETVVNDDGTTRTNEVWDWSRISDFRIGRYTAKLVAVYNDGQHDIPIEKEVSFWVIPWKILLGALLVLALTLFGVWTLVRKIWLVVKKGKKQPSK